MQNDTLGMRIERLITATGMTKTAFAEKIKVTQPYISKLIANKGIPSERLIEDICEKMGVNREWLLHGGPDKDMFKPEYENDELSDFCAEISEGRDPFIAEMLLKYKGLSQRHKQAIWEIYEELTEKKKD